MGIELQIGTSKATSSLAALEKSVASLEAKMKGFSGGNKINNSISGIKPIPAGVGQSVNKASDGLNKLGTSAKNAEGKLAGLKSTMSGLRSSFGLFASVLATIGVTNFVKGSLEMVNALDKMDATFKGMTGSAKAGGEALAFVTAESRRTATPLRENINNFTKLSVIGTKLGFTQNAVNKAFADSATTLRSFGANAQQSNRFMNALAQVMAKGKGTAEELRQQMGEIAPILPLIAQAAGKSMGQLEADMANGLVTVQDVFNGLSLAASQGSDILVEAMKKPGAQIILMQNAWQQLQGAFGQSVIPTLVPVFQSLAAVFRGMAGDMTGAASTSRALGSALRGVGTVIGVLTPALLAIGAAFLVIKANAAATVLIAWGTSLAGAATIAATAAGTFLRTGAAIVAMTSSMGVSAAASVAFSGALGILRVAAVAVIGSLGPLLAVTAAITAAYLAYTAITAEAEEKQLGLGQAAATVVDEMRKQEKVTNDAKKATTLFFEVVDDMASAEQQAAQEARNAAVEIQKLERAGREVSAELRAAASGAVALANGASTAAGQMDKGATSAKKMAAAVKAIPSSKKITITTEHKSINRQTGGELSSNSFDSDNAVDRATGGGTSSSSARDADGFLLSNFSKGGVTGKGGHGGGRMNARKYKFNQTTPRFANGGATGIGAGGSPAILHPNEAVIPLSSGSVPVQFSGGGGGGLAPKLLKAGNLNTSRMLERFSTMISLNKDFQMKMTADSRLSLIALRKINATLGSDFKFMTDSIVAAISSLQLASASTGSFSSGPAGNFTGTVADTGAADQGADLAAARTQLDKLIRDRSKSGGSVGVLSPEFNFNGGRTRAPGDVEKAVAQTNARNQAAIDRENEIGDLQEILGLQRDILNVRKSNVTADDFKPRYNINIMPFAKGTPNTSKESGLRQTGGNGGMLAQLHPNEAVIPLPDGRSVPVMLKGGSDGGGGIGGGGAPNVSVNVTMNVDSKDAGSFARSKPQMMQDLTLEIRNAMRSVGEPESSDLSRTSQRVVKKG